MLTHLSEQVLTETRHKIQPAMEPKTFLIRIYISSQPAIWRDIIKTYLILKIWEVSCAVNGVKKFKCFDFFKNILAPLWGRLDDSGFSYIFFVVNSDITQPLFISFISQIQSRHA